MEESKNNKEEENVESSEHHPGNTDIEREVNGNQKKCRYCQKSICMDAKVCHYCGRHQSRFWQHFRIEHIGLLASIIMVFIALSQLREARNERIDASNTLERAQEAEKVASKALRISELLEEKNKLAEEKLHVIDSTVEKAEKKLEQIELLIVFNTIVLNAQNDDRKAFDQLRTWMDKKTFLLSSQAFNAWTRILDEHNQPPMKKLPSVPWSDGTEPSELSLSDLKRYYKSINLYFRPSLIKYIWQREDFSKYERMEFLADVLKSDNSLRAVEYAGRYFSKATGLKKKTLAVLEFLDWWEKNKNDFKE